MPNRNLSTDELKLADELLAQDTGAASTGAMPFIILAGRPRRCLDFSPAPFATLPQSERRAGGIPLATLFGKIPLSAPFVPKTL